MRLKCKWVEINPNEFCLLEEGLQDISECHLDSNWVRETISIAPFFSFTLNYNKYAEDFCTPTKCQFLDGTETDAHKFSNDFRVEAVANICQAKGIWISNSIRNVRYAREKAEDDRMFFWYQKGFTPHVSICVGFIFPDVLNMNPLQFSGENIQELRDACDDYPIIEKSLNHSVFERELTDLEKVISANKFIKEFARRLSFNQMPNDKDEYLKCHLSTLNHS